MGRQVKQELFAGGRSGFASENPGDFIEDEGDDQGYQAACHYTKDSFQGQVPLLHLFFMDQDDTRAAMALRRVLVSLRAMPTAMVKVIPRHSNNKLGMWTG